MIVTSSFHVLNKEKTMKQTFAPFLSELEATTKKKTHGLYDELCHVSQ